MSFLEGDIEDISPGIAQDIPQFAPEVRIKHPENDIDEQNIQVAQDCIIPERYKLWIVTFGCAHNFADGEYMKGILSDYGFHIVENRDEAVLWVLNSCTVKDPSETVFRNYIAEAKQKGKRIVVAGCVPQADSEADWLQEFSILGVKQIHRIIEVVEETLKGNNVHLLSLKELPPLDLPKIRRDPHIEIIPISEGCLGHCTYCKTRFARGRLMSYPLQSILGRVESAIRDNMFEVWLSSEDTGAYGIDHHQSIVDLLQEIPPLIPPHSNTMLRLGMTNPPYILQHLPEIAAFLRHPNVFSFIHIPVQSGSDAVLETMQREYTVEEFCRVVDFLSKEVPGLTIATDIIIGFASETEEDHAKTMQLLEKYKFAVVNISKFFPRPGTPAARMKHISSSVVKTRSAECSAWFKSLHPYRRFVGACEMVWVGSETSGDYMVAHTKAYVKVLVPCREELRGKRVVVRVLEATRFHVVGEIIDEHPAFVSDHLAPDELSAYISSLYSFPCCNKQDTTSSPGLTSERSWTSMCWVSLHACHLRLVPAERTRAASFCIRSNDLRQQRIHWRRGGLFLGRFLFLWSRFFLLGLLDHVCRNHVHFVQEFHRSLSRLDSRLFALFMDVIWILLWR